MTVSGDYGLNWDYACTIMYDVWAVGGDGTGLEHKVRAVLITDGQENHTKDYVCTYERPANSQCTASASTNSPTGTPRHSGQIVFGAKGFAWAWNAANNTAGSYPIKAKACFEPNTGTKAWNYDVLLGISATDTYMTSIADCVEFDIEYKDANVAPTLCPVVDLASAPNPNPIPGC